MPKPAPSRGFPAPRRRTQPGVGRPALSNAHSWPAIHANSPGVNRRGVDYIAVQHIVLTTGAGSGAWSNKAPMTGFDAKEEAPRRQRYQRARDTMHPDSSEATPTAATVLTFVALALVCMAIVIGMCLRLADQFEPTVGDIADFSARHANQDVLPVSATATAGARTCVLASEVMARSGGSFVIVARPQGADGSYLIHWAGSHTSNGAADCGSSADLLVSKPDLLSLAGAAGGFGIHLGGSKA